MTAGDIVRVHSPLGFHNVFCALKKLKGGERPKLDVEFTWGKVTLKFTGPNQLDITDQSVLLAVLKVAQTDCRLAEQQGDAIGRVKLAKVLKHSGRKFWFKNILVQTSFRELARLSKDSGWDGGTATHQIQASLTRLAETTVWVKEGKVKAGSRLVAWELGDDRRVLLSLHWRLVEALFGKAYSQVCIDERRCLPSDVAKALHFLLSCQLKHGRAIQYRLNTLQAHVWGGVASDVTLRKRVSRLRPALLALGALEGWTITLNDDLAKVYRQPRKTSKIPG